MRDAGLQTIASTAIKRIERPPPLPRPPPRSAGIPGRRTRGVP
jgi:hypothetical protein